MLKIRVDQYQTKALLNGFLYREYRDLTYVERPVSEIQQLNLFIPQAYYQQESINGYTAATAPIFVPNTVGGYLPGPADFPGNDQWPSRSKTIEAALQRGYVVASPGLRGRTQQNESGDYIGKAPAFIVDLKAAIRFLRHNAEHLPGNYERIITNGTSAGGATSALAGVSGNHPFFQPLLDELGAAKGSDAIYAASCYCPIHNLEHADLAYEWQFNGITTYHNQQMDFKTDPPRAIAVDGELTNEQQKLSKELKQGFRAYFNQLNLHDQQGKELTIDQDGKGSFLKLIQALIMQSAQQALNEGQTLSAEAGLTVVNQQVVGIDWPQYLAYIGRKKAVPAFDDLTLASAENDLFGTRQIPQQHFTDFGQLHSQVKASQADPALVAAVNPIHYLTETSGQTAHYWRIRHGASDRDTAFSIPLILALFLQDQGKQVDFAYPWGIGHDGDYDLVALFDWIDQICQ